MITKRLFVLSLGGSLIVPDEIDIKFLRKFKNLILMQIKKGNRFIIITGGGKACRKYQTALRLVTNPTSTDLDWMGIYTTHSNAQFIRLMFGKLAHPRIVDNPTKKLAFKEKILIAGGWMPGCSTDKDAVFLAKTFGAKTVINLSNIDFLYDKNPKEYRDAKKISRISWSGLLKITGYKWKPGANVPFDPEAAKLAQKNKLQVIIANGKNLKNLQNIFEGKNFKSTIIG